MCSLGGFHVVIFLVVSGAPWASHWYYLTTPKHDYHDSRVLGWISGSILGHLGCHGPPNGTIFRSQVLGELACSGHLEAGWHSSFSLVASYIPGFIFLVLYSWLYIPGFVFALYSWICIPGFICLVLYSWFYTPGFILPVLYFWFIFLVLDSWFYIPGMVFLASWLNLWHIPSRPVINIQPLGVSRARFPYSGPSSKTYHFLKRKSANS